MYTFKTTNHWKNMRYTLPLILFTFLFLLTGPPVVIGESILNKISRSDNKDRIKLVLQFSKLPKYDVVTNVRRINVILTDTNATELKMPKPDSYLVKSLRQQKKGQTELSFFLRHPPKNVSVTQGGNANVLIIEIILGNSLSTKYPDITAQLKDVSFLQRKETDFTHPLRLSQFAEDWKEAFKKYENDLLIEPDLRLTLPPYPMLSTFSDEPIPDSIVTPEILKAAESGKWDMVYPQLKEIVLTNTDISISPLLYITYCEALVRYNAYTEPFKLAQQIIQSYPESPAALLAEFLTLYIQLQHEEPFTVRRKLKEFEHKASNIRPLLPYINLLRAEAAIITEQYKEADELLARPDIGYPKGISQVRQLRQADLRHIRKNNIASLVSYLQLGDVSDIIKSHPRSLAYFCSDLYHYKRYQTAETYYQLLSDLLTGKKNQDIVLFRLAMTRLKLYGPEKATPSLFQIQDSFPNTKGAFLAHLKITDLTFLNKNISYNDAADRYGYVAVNGISKDIRQEGFFKKALIHALAHKKQLSISLLMQMLREFGSGKLQIEAKALLITQLPEAIHELVSTNHYIEALVLAKKARTYFSSDWLNKNILLDLADAYMALGAFERAANLLTYLLDSSSEDEQKELFKPLLESLYQSGWYEQLNHYVQRYIHTFPPAANLPEIFLLRIKGLRKENKVEQLLDLFSSTHPTSPEIKQEMAEIYFETGHYGKVIPLLIPITAIYSEANTALLFRLAESYYQTQQYTSAVQEFQKLTNDKQYGDQALFRLAKIELAANKQENGLNLLKKLAEKDPQSLWSKLAIEEIYSYNLSAGNFNQ